MIGGMLLALLGPTDAEAGGCTRDLGSAYLKASADAYQALTFQAPGESERSDGNYVGQQYGIYAEAGLSSKHPIQIAVAAPLVTVGTHSTEIFDAFGELPVRATTVRAGDLRVWAQTALSNRAPIAAGLEVKVPLYANGGVGESLRNFDELFPKPGDGQVDVTAWLYAGHAISAKTFAEVGAGYLWRTDAFVGWETAIRFNDGFRLLGKVGTTVGPVLLVGGLDGQFVFSGMADGEVDLYTRRFLAAFGSALIDVGDSGFAIEPRIAYEVWAVNASQGWGGGLGVSWRR